MSNQIDALFANFRPTAFKQSVNQIPQEVAAGSGNIAPTGWLQDGSVTADVISANAVTAGKIDAGAVTATTIAAGSVTTDKIAANAVTAAKIEANTITANEIAANTITSSQIAADTITASQIAANAITASEIAANAVTTTKILAANVTSAKMEVTISGKRFSGTTGSQAAPGYTFDSDAAAGMYYNSGLSMVFGNAEYLLIGPNVELASNRIVPDVDNTHTLGKSGKRWSAVWAANGTIQTSDERLKKDIADAPLGLGFVRKLRARVFRWRDTPDTQADEAAEVDQEALDRETAPLMERIAEIRASGEDDVQPEINALQAQLDEIRHRHMDPVREARRKRREGKRLHYGLIAQEVKEALDAAGVSSKDAAFWSQAPDGTQSLVYTELIPVLLKSIQELADRVDHLELTARGRNSSKEGRDAGSRAVHRKQGAPASALGRDVHSSRRGILIWQSLAAGEPASLPLPRSADRFRMGLVTSFVRSPARAFVSPET